MCCDDLLDYTSSENETLLGIASPAFGISDRYDVMTIINLNVDQG